MCFRCSTRTLIPIVFSQVRDHARCIRIVSWAAAQLHHLGWEGDDVSTLSPAIESKEVPAFIACGWVIWGLTIRIGVLTGKRDLLLTVVELPDEVSTSFVLSPD